MDKELIKYKNIFSVVSIVLLLLAIPAIWPYGYYIFLRWVITAIAVFFIWITSKIQEQKWSGLMVVIAILFNPIIPIYLTKEIWVVIDLIVAGLFLLSIFKIKNR
jgi:hypothetical protein